MPGDVIVVSEGDQICADARLRRDQVELDISTLNGESLPVLRTPVDSLEHGPLLDARDLLFSGTTCTEGEAVAVVHATGMHTELGRIAAVSQRVGTDESPLEQQVKRVAKLIAVVAIGMGLAFIPLGTLLAGLTGHPFHRARLLASVSPCPPMAARHGPCGTGSESPKVLSVWDCRATE